MPVVLDSSVVLAYLLDERGRELAEQAIGAGGLLSTVNLAEVMSRLMRDGADPAASAEVLLALPVTVVPLDADLAITSGAIFAQTRKFGLSLGDRACLALAKREAVPALTGDRAWLQVAQAVGVEVRLIR
jgi:ribonuclease VapC